VAGFSAEPEKKGADESDSMATRDRNNSTLGRILLKALSSVKLAVSLLSLMALVLIVATLIRNQDLARRYIYHSWWFISLLGLFYANLLFCTAGRWSLRIKKIGTTVTHSGVFVMVVGVVIGAIWGQHGFIQLYMGQSSDIFFVKSDKAIKLPFVVNLEDFKVERYTDRGVRETLVVYLADRNLTRTFPVRVGKEVKLSGTPYSFEILRYEPDFVVLERGTFGSRSDEPRNPAIQVRVNDGRENKTVWLFAKFPGLHQDPSSNIRLFYQRTERIKAFKSRVRILQDGRGVASKTIEVNKPLRYGGYSIYQSDYDEEHEAYSVLGIVKDPGVLFVYIGFAVISAGVLFTFYLRPILVRRARRPAVGQTNETATTTN
jgi:hypothetical protein